MRLARISASADAVQVLAQEHELVPGEPGQGVARPHQVRQPVGDGDQQLVADLMAVGVVDLLEAVEVGEQDRGVGVRTLAALGGVLEALLQQQPVRQPGQRVVQGVVVEAVGRGAGLVASLGIEQVGGRDVGQRLRRAHVVRVELAGRVAVQIERAEPAVAVAQREREHRGQPGRERGRGERRESIVGAEVGDGDGLPGCRTPPGTGPARSRSAAARSATQTRRTPRCSAAPSPARST